MSWWSLCGLDEEGLFLGAEDEFNPPGKVPWPANEIMVEEITAAYHAGKTVDCWVFEGLVTAWRSFARV